MSTKFLVIALMVLVSAGMAYAVLEPVKDILPINHQFQFVLEQPQLSEDDLLKLLQSGTYEQKIEAAKGLAAIGTVKSVIPLLNVLKEHTKLAPSGHYKSWYQDELGKVSEGALIAIGHALKQPVEALIIENLKAHTNPNTDTGIILALARILSQIGTETSLRPLGEAINLYLRPWPVVGNPKKELEEAYLSIVERIERSSAYDAFIKQNNEQFNFSHLVGVLGSLKDLETILLSLKDELVQTYALNNSGKLGELLSEIFVVRSKSLEDVSWRRDAGRDPMGNLYPEDIIEFKGKDEGGKPIIAKLVIRRLETSYGYSSPVNGAITGVYLAIRDLKGEVIKEILAKPTKLPKPGEPTLERRGGYRVPFRIGDLLFIPGANTP